VPNPLGVDDARVHLSATSVVPIESGNIDAM
jgi:hypothetical protein